MRAPKEGPTTILLVDDHEVVRIGLRALLDGVPGFRVVGEGATKRDRFLAGKAHPWSGSAKR